jgi:hypothetical protein
VVVVINFTFLYATSRSAPRVSGAKSDNTTTAAPENTVNNTKTPNKPADDSKYGNVNVITVDNANSVATAIELAADLTN